MTQFVQFGQPMSTFALYALSLSIPIAKRNKTDDMPKTQYCRQKQTNNQHNSSPATLSFRFVGHILLGQYTYIAIALTRHTQACSQHQNQQQPIFAGSTTCAWFRFREARQIDWAHSIGFEQSVDGFLMFFCHDYYIGSRTIASICGVVYSEYMILNVSRYVIRC